MFVSKETIQQIKEKINSEQFSEEWFEQLKADDRQGVKNLINQYEKKKEKKRQLELQFQQLTKIERELRLSGYNHIAGIDEVGRGPLAGPVVAASVILPEDFTLLGINDSKQLTEEKRNLFYDVIYKQALAVGIGIANHDEIDQLNIYRATELAMKRALTNLSVAPDYVLIDAMNLSQIPIKQKSIVKGDTKSVSIAAASIIAKVTRDRMMSDYHESYPNYHFHKNKGYGTKDHIESLKKFGPSPIHRKTFQPKLL